MGNDPAKEIRRKFLEKMKGLHPEHPLRKEYERAQARVRATNKEIKR